MYNFSKLSLTDLKTLRDLSEVEMENWEESVSRFTGSEEEKQQREDYRADVSLVNGFHNLLSHIDEELHDRIYEHIIHNEEFTS
jgi:hypothetical protein